MRTTIIVAIFAGIFLAHIFASAIKAAAIVAAVLAVFYIGRGVSYEALIDDGARKFWNDRPAHVEYGHRPTRRI